MWDLKGVEKPNFDIDDLRQVAPLKTPMEPKDGNFQPGCLGFHNGFIAINHR